MPAPDGTFTKVAPQAVVSAMTSPTGGMLIASSTMPIGQATEFSVSTGTPLDAAGWLLCDLTTRKSVHAEGGTASWASPAEGGSLLLFASDTPCHSATTADKTPRPGNDSTRAAGL